MPAQKQVHQYKGKELRSIKTQAQQSWKDPVNDIQAGDITFSIGLSAIFGALRASRRVIRGIIAIISRYGHVSDSDVYWSEVAIEVPRYFHQHI